MSQTVLIALALALFAVIDVKASEKECSFDNPDQRDGCFEFVPYAEYDRFIPLLNEANRPKPTHMLLKYNYTAKHKLSRYPWIAFRESRLTSLWRRLERVLILEKLRNSSDIPNIADIMSGNDYEDEGPQPEKLKQWYYVTILTNDGNIYSGYFGETKGGKGVMQQDYEFDGRYNTPDRLKITKELLEKRDFKGLFEYWKTVKTPNETPDETSDPKDLQECSPTNPDDRVGCFEFVPYTEYDRFIPLLKEASRPDRTHMLLRYTDKHKQRLERILLLEKLRNPARNIPIVIENLEGAEDQMPTCQPQLPQLKQWYFVTILTNDGNIYSGYFGEIKDGKGYMGLGHAFEKRFHTSDRLFITKKLLEKKDFKGLYEYWKSVKNSDEMGRQEQSW